MNPITADIYGVKSVSEVNKMEFDRNLHNAFMEVKSKGFIVLDCSFSTAHLDKSRVQLSALVVYGRLVSK